jgi:hypothetical protein
MASSRFHNILRDKISKVILEYSESIIGGFAKDHADYRDACGYIRGLNDALRLCEDIERDQE